MTGALVIGGDYRALGVVRSLGRRGIPVWVLRSPDDHRLAGTSRYVDRRLEFPADGDEARVGVLHDLAERCGVHGWVLFPTADATAALVARHHATLQTSYRLTTPAWPTFERAYDKRCTAELAAELGIPHPRTVAVRSRADAEAYSGAYPVVVKPATKSRLNLPAVKAWRVDDAAGLTRCYEEAAAQADPGSLMIQELIPGERGAQFSYAALCQRGQPIVSVTAERVRQYPLDFGRSSTFVMSVQNDEVAELGGRVLSRLGLSGLAEVEFKRDARDGSYRLLDVNVRVWGWHTIGRRAGLDFAYMAWRLAVGGDVTPMRAPAGLRWLRLTTDLPIGIREVTGRRLAGATYLRSVLARHEPAVRAADDPLPGLLEMPLFALSRCPQRPPVLKRRSTGRLAVDRGTAILDQRHRPHPLGQTGLDRGGWRVLRSHGSGVPPHDDRMARPL